MPSREQVIGDGDFAATLKMQRVEWARFVSNKWTHLASEYVANPLMAEAIEDIRALAHIVESLTEEE